MKSTYLWEAKTLKGMTDFGIIENRSRKAALRTLRNKEYYQVCLTVVSEKILNSAVANKEIISILDSFLMLLNSGISMNETLDLLINDKKSIVAQFVFCKIRLALHQGKSLQQGFKGLKPLFSDFFISMINLCEKTGNLRQGLNSLKDFYLSQEFRHQELQRLTRYPKIVLSLTLLISLGVIIFIIPMFENIYALYQDDLPILTRIMVYLSRFAHKNGIIILMLGACFLLWAILPKVSRFHPWLFLNERVRKIINTREDPFLYAHAMKILLQSGQPVNLATIQAAGCMSTKNQKYGFSLANKLNAGLSFSEAFQELIWFPSTFQKFIASAEKAGLLQVGFEQVYHYINRQRENQFEKWSGFVEPILMLVLGTIILILLLSIYLPIFDLGNRLG